MVARGILMRVHELRQGTSAAMRSIADAIERNPKTVAASSIRDLAQVSHTSASTIVRFCRQLGCVGYKEFQRELVYELASIEGNDDLALDGISRGDVTERILRKVLSSDVRSIEATERLLDPDVLDECARALIDCRVVLLFGVGASLLVARDLELKLSRVDKECHCDDDLHTQLLRARNAHADDVCVVFSYSGVTPEMLECARLARKRGARIIAVTRAVGSELADEADWTLGVASTEPLLRSGAMGSRMSQLLVVDALYAVYVTKDYDRSTKTMLRNYDDKTSERKTADA